MGCRILYDSEQNYAALFCSTTELVFGPLFSESENGEHDAQECAEAFMRWLKHDPRVLDNEELQSAFSEWRAQCSEQFKREDAEMFPDEERAS